MNNLTTQFLNSGALELTVENINATLALYEFSFVMFYTTWCIHSQRLMPIFEEAANKIQEEFPGPGKVILAKVDCENEKELEFRYHIKGYPTLKFFVNGMTGRPDYKEERTVEALVNFVRQHIEDPVMEFSNLTDIINTEPNNGTIIGYFDGKDQAEYNTLRRVAMNLKDDCQFYAQFGEEDMENSLMESPVVRFYEDPSELGGTIEAFTGNLTNFYDFYTWSYKKCLNISSNDLLPLTNLLVNDEITEDIHENA